MSCTQFRIGIKLGGGRLQIFLKTGGARGPQAPMDDTPMHV